MAVALEIEFEHSRGNFHYFIDSSCFLDYSNKQLTLMLILFAQFILSLWSDDTKSLEGGIINHIIVFWTLISGLLLQKHTLKLYYIMWFEMR